MSKAKSEVGTVEVESQLPASVSSFEEDGLEFVEELTSEEIGLPRIKIAVGTSDNHGTAAKDGEIYNPVTSKVYGEGMLVVPVHFTTSWCEWKSVQGDAPVNTFYSEKDLPPTVRREDKQWREIIQVNGEDHPEDNYIGLNHDHYVLIVDPETGACESALIAMTNTRIKKSKALNTTVVSQIAQGANGPFRPPRFAYLYNFKTIKEQNAKKQLYHNWQITIDRMLDLENATEQMWYGAAKSFKKAVIAGEVKVSAEVPEEVTQSATETFEPSPFG